STNRKRKPKWRRCVAASIAVGPSAILTGSRTRPSDWGWNRRFGPAEDRRNNRRLATVTGGCLLFFLLYSPNLVAVSFHSQIWWLFPFIPFSFPLTVLCQSSHYACLRTYEAGLATMGSVGAMWPYR